MVSTEATKIRKEHEAEEPYKLAWSSFNTNAIRTYDSKLKATSEIDDGAQISTPGFAYTIIDSIPQANCLLSSISNDNISNFVMLEMGKKPRAVYQLGMVEGSISDMSCNSRTGRVALLPIKDRIAYHLFDCYSLQVIQKAKWKILHEDDITGLDLNLDGDRIGTIDRSGIFTVSDISSDSYLFGVQLGDTDSRNRCRWNSAHPYVALTFNRIKFNIVDMEMEKLLHSESLNMNKQAITWIDWNTDGNLLVSCSQDKSVRLYDLRLGYPVKTISDLHLQGVIQVKWSPKGDMIATASADGTVKVTDISTGWTYYTGRTADASIFIVYTLEI